MSARSTKVVFDKQTGTVYLEATIKDSDVYSVLQEIDEYDHDEFIVRAIKIGVLAIRDAHAVAKADYVEKAFYKMKHEFDQVMDNYFGERGAVTAKIHETFGNDGHIDRKIIEFFGDKGRFEAIMDQFIGEDGKLKRSVDGALGENGAFHKTVTDFFGENGRLRRELDREFGEDGGRLYRILNPNDAKTPLGQFRQELERQFNPDREGSALWKLKEDVRIQIEEMKTALGIQEAVAHEHQRGTAKGRAFEAVVYETIEEIASCFGDRADHVGNTSGPLGIVGDVVVTLDGESIGGGQKKVVLEAKNRKVTYNGKGSIYKELDRAMENRDADFAIAVISLNHANANAPLRYVAPSYLLVTLDEEDPDPLPLKMAYHVSRVLAAAKGSKGPLTIDLKDVEVHLKKIESQMENIRSMKTALTGAVGNIDQVKKALDILQSEVLGTINQLHHQIRMSSRH